MLMPALSCSVIFYSVQWWWTVAHQVPLSMEISRRRYWSGLLFPPPWYLPYPQIKPIFPASPALAGMLFTTSGTWEAWHDFL